MKEATNDDVTNQAQTHEPVNTTINEIKQSKLSMKRFVSFVNLFLHLQLVALIP